MASAQTDELLVELDRMSSSTFKREQRAERERRGQDDDVADNASDEDRRRIDEFEMRGRNLVRRDLIRRHNVLMIRVGYDCQTDDRYFWDSAAIVQSKADNCMVIANNIDKSKDSVRQMDNKTSYLCEWFPVTLNGYLRNFLYFLRSWFTGMFSYSKSLYFAPSIIFVDAHPITIPLLKLFFNCPVVSFGFFDDMLDRKKFAILPFEAETTLAAIRNFCMSRADELLVPSKATGYKFTKQAKYCSFTPTVFYPPVHGRGDTSSTFRLKYYFLIIGPWQKYARMEFALLACQRFFNVDLDEYFKPLVRFVFIGYMDENNQNAIDYKVRMYKMFKAAKKPFGSCILTFTNPTASQLATHYRNCVGVMNVTTCDFAWPLIEAVYHGRQVICLLNNFTNEIIRHGINGFLQGTNIKVFATQINYLFMYATEGMPSYAAKRIANKFSYAGRRNTIDELLLKYFPLTENE